MAQHKLLLYTRCCFGSVRWFALARSGSLHSCARIPEYCNNKIIVVNAAAAAADAVLLY